MSCCLQWWVIRLLHSRAHHTRRELRNCQTCYSLFYYRKKRSFSFIAFANLAARYPPVFLCFWVSTLMPNQIFTSCQLDLVRVALNKNSHRVVSNNTARYNRRLKGWRKEDKNYFEKQQCGWITASTRDNTSSQTPYTTEESWTIV